RQWDDAPGNTFRRPGLTTPAVEDGEPEESQPRADSLPAPPPAQGEPAELQSTAAAEGCLTGTDSARRLPFSRSVVPSDYDSEETKIVTKKTDAGEPPLVTGNYSGKNPLRSETYRKSKKRPAKPKIPGCEVRNYEAGWNVFRVWYDPKKPGE